ncbi:MAG: OmpA family protein [Thermodesulfobacteriota bacterium]
MNKAFKTDILTKGLLLSIFGALFILSSVLLYKGAANAEQQASCIKPANELIGNTKGIESRDIFFDYESDQIRDDAKEVLASNADIMKRNPGIFVIIEGDFDINETDGKLLAESRAHNVRDFIIDQGVEAGRILTSTTCERTDINAPKSVRIPELDRRVHFISLEMQQLNTV